MDLNSQIASTDPVFSNAGLSGSSSYSSITGGDRDNFLRNGFSHNATQSNPTIPELRKLDAAQSVEYTDAAQMFSLPSGTPRIPWNPDLTGQNRSSRASTARDRQIQIQAGAIDALTGIGREAALARAGQIFEDEYLVGDWNGDGRDDLAVRRGSTILKDINGDGKADLTQVYGLGNKEDEYLVGDWNGDGKDDIAVRRGSTVLKDINGDGKADLTQAYGLGNKEGQYLVGDWNGDGKDELAVRRGSTVLKDINGDGKADLTQAYGLGNKEGQYLVGDWNGDGKDDIAVRRGSTILKDINGDGKADLTQAYGLGNKEGQYLVGDWNGDGKDDIAVRRGSTILKDTNGDGKADLTEVYGLGVAPPAPVSPPKPINGGGATADINQQGLALIKKFEGLSLRAYRDSVGKWTIGYGHTGPEVGPGDVITRAEAERLLNKDSDRFEAAVRSRVKVPLNSNQFSALVSFTYNLGEGTLGRSTLLKLLNRGNYQGAADQFPRFVYGGGKKLPGLIRRRREERALFLS